MLESLGTGLFEVGPPQTGTVSKVSGRNNVGSDTPRNEREDGGSLWPGVCRIPASFPFLRLSLQTVAAPTAPVLRFAGAPGLQTPS